MKYKHTIIIGLIGLFSTVLHLLPGIHFEYHRDELLYFSLCNHLASGYASTPPLTALMAFAAKSMLGYSVFAVRLFPAVFSGLLVYLSALVAKESGGSFRSRLLAATGTAGSMLLVMIYGVFTPYFIDIFLWTATLYLIIKYVNTNSDKYLLLMGIVIGFAFLNKYSIVFLLIAVFLVLPFTKHRHLFFHKYFYLSMLLAILIASPNIYWQIQHHFPVLGHMKELKDSQLVNVNPLEFIIEQLIFLLPFTVVILPGIVFFLINKQFKEYRFLLIISAVVILLFLLLHGKGFYTSGLFPFLIVTGALFIEKVVFNRYAFYSLLVLLVTTSVLLVPLSLPVFKQEKMISYFDGFAKITGSDLLRKDEDGHYRKLPQVNADMLGWNEIAAITDKAWTQVEAKNNCFIFCANYGQAGAISIIGKKYGLPEPISFSDAYRLWIPLSFNNDIKEIIYVVGSDALNSGNFRDTKNFFSEMAEVGSVANPLAIEYDTRIYLFKKPKSNFNDFWKDQISGY